jgi:hypothetical protein
VTVDQGIGRIEAIERLLSLERLSRYTLLGNGDRAEAIRLYEWNTRVSEAFYTPLQGLEVCLRNSLSLELIAHLGANWYENQHGLFEHPLTEMLANATQSLERDGKDINLGRMVAELNFGFWVSVLAPRYDTTLWRPCLRKAFPNRPRGMERKDIHKALNALRRLRNRVAHHEPIVHRDLKRDHDLIVSLLSCACPHTATWVKSQSRVIAEL